MPWLELPCIKSLLPQIGNAYLIAFLTRQPSLNPVAFEDKTTAVMMAIVLYLRAPLTLMPESGIFVVCQNRRVFIF